MEKMKNDFTRSGYVEEDLKEIEKRAKVISSSERRHTESTETITFHLFYFKEIRRFRKILRDSEEDLKLIIGETKIIMAVKKNPSIGNTVIRNRNLSTTEHQLVSQKCGASNCRQCPLVNTDPQIFVNNMKLKPGKDLNCKSRNVIYLWQCNNCEEENSYFGRTIQKAHDRTNTHRRCFSEDKWEDSALSMHARTKHEELFDLQNFKITLVKKCSPQTIRREEFKFIDKYRTKIRGINRYKN